MLSATPRSAAAVRSAAAYVAGSRSSLMRAIGPWTAIAAISLPRSS